MLFTMDTTHRPTTSTQARQPPFSEKKKTPRVHSSIHSPPPSMQKRRFVSGIKLQFPFPTRAIQNAVQVVSRRLERAKRRAPDLRYTQRKNEGTHKINQERGEKDSINTRPRKRILSEPSLSPCT